MDEIRTRSLDEALTDLGWKLQSATGRINPDGRFDRLQWARNGTTITADFRMDVFESATMVWNGREYHLTRDDWQCITPDLA